MYKTIKQIPEGLSFFRLPFDKGTVRLSLSTLNEYTTHRRIQRPYEKVEIKKIGYHHETLIIAIWLKDDVEERVYIKVTPTCLLVSCSVDTHETHLGRYAYLALNQLIYVDEYYDFNKYYWPGFFNPKTGKSKFLNIIHDRKGLDLIPKPKYSSFYKPGQKLIYPLRETTTKTRLKLKLSKESILTETGHTIGYCFADTLMGAWRTNHFPFLIPYSAIVNKKKNAVKSYVYFIREQADLPPLNYTTHQQKLNELCFKMMMLAPINSPKYNSTQQEKERIYRSNINRRDKLFQLWQQAIPYLSSQLFTHHYHTYGMSNVIDKPAKNEMQVCTFSAKIPKLCFIWLDRGEYYELALRIKLGTRKFKPLPDTPIFVVATDTQRKNFYLLETITDYVVLTFFKKYKFKMLVLKCHYEVYFKGFKEHLARVYEFNDTLKSTDIN